LTNQIMTEDKSSSRKVRIQKLLSAAGVASRRKIEQMVREGRITVNGKVVKKLPCLVSESDEIRLDGQLVRKKPEKKVYILLNKPRGVICTQRDETGAGRPRAIDLVGAIDKRLYCAGRLDADSTGLIILTNDGELTERLTHPRYGLVKTYIVRVEGRVTKEQLLTLRKGIFLARSKAKAGRAGAVRARVSAVKILHAGNRETLLEVRMAEGRNREIRRMLARLGHKVIRLHRCAIGSITDRGIKIGKYRFLSEREVSQLRKETGLEE